MWCERVNGESEVGFRKERKEERRNGKQIYIYIYIYKIHENQAFFLCIPKPDKNSSYTSTQFKLSRPYPPVNSSQFARYNAFVLGMYQNVFCEASIRIRVIFTLSEGTNVRNWILDFGLDLGSWQSRSVAKVR